MHYINKPLEKGIILSRRIHPTLLYEEVSTNVPSIVTYHSPTGFEWGYAGSGPADLALNLAELVVEKAGLKTTQGLHCSNLAWQAKQTVKELIVMNVPEEGAVIAWKLVCYAVLDACTEKNREKLQKYIDNLE